MRADPPVPPAPDAAPSPMDAAALAACRRLGVPGAVVYASLLDGDPLRPVGRAGTGAEAHRAVIRGDGFLGRVWQLGVAGVGRETLRLDEDATSVPAAAAPIWLGGAPVALLAVLGDDADAVDLAALEGVANDLSWTLLETGVVPDPGEEAGLLPGGLNQLLASAGVLFGHAPAGVAVLASDGSIRFSNRRLRELVGGEPGVVDELWAPDHADPVVDGLVHDLLAGRGHDHTVAAVVGRRFPVPVRAHLLAFRADGENGVLLTIEPTAPTPRPERGDGLDDALVAAQPEQRRLLEVATAWFAARAEGGSRRGEAWLLCIRSPGPGTPVVDPRLGEVRDAVGRALRRGDRVLGLHRGGVFVGFGAGDAHEAELAAHRLVSRAAAVLARGGRDVQLGGGLVHLAEGPVDGHLVAAEAAAGRAVPCGGGVSVAWADPERLARGARARVLTAALDRAQPFADLVLAYQPIFDLRRGTIVEAEALVRWPHPELGAVSPGEFLPLVRRVGLLPELGDWVFEKALAQLARWRRARPDLRVAVNVDPTQLHHRDLVAFLHRALGVHRLPASALTLELTEHAWSADDAATVQLGHLADAGFRLAIDDFGAGHSSLGRLLKVPATAVKLDRSLLPRTADEPRGWAFLGKAMELVRVLGCEVVAEGVELPEQADRLRGLGCTHAQGFALGRPAPPENLLG